MLVPLADEEGNKHESVGAPEYVSHRSNRQKISRNWPWEVTDRDHIRYRINTVIKQLNYSYPLGCFPESLHWIRDLPDDPP